MGDWGFLAKLLDQVQEHSTAIGKIWLTVLFIFRILVLGLAGESVWGDEQSDFVCNTIQPGCTNVCYDKAFPISHIRYWVLQFLFVSTPTLVFLGHIVYLSQREAKLKEQEAELQALESKNYSVSAALMAVEKKMAKISVGQSGRFKIHGAVMRTYILSVLAKSLFEAGFLVGQWFLYGIIMDSHYICEGLPCPYQVDCFVSRPTEKTIFIIFMVVMGLISLVLNLVELFYLCGKSCSSSFAPPLPCNPNNFSARLCEMPNVEKPYFCFPMAEKPSQPCQAYKIVLPGEQNQANFSIEETLALQNGKKPHNICATRVSEVHLAQEKQSFQPTSNGSKKQYV